MSEHDIRRPRRIIAGEVPPAPDLPPATATATAPAPVLRQAERFQRTLGQPGRRDTGRTERAPVHPTEKRAASAPPASAGPAPPASARSTPSELTTPAAHASTAAATTTFANLPSYATAAATPGFHAGSEEPPEGWTEELATLIATLCRQSEPAFEAWTVVVPLDPRVLPETELRLALSRHRLSLRFHTQSPHSVHLVSRHRSSLIALIEQAMPSSRDIDIDVT